MRIEAPIPGKAAVGVEVPNKSAATVLLRDIIDSQEFAAMTSPVSMAMGKDIGGKIVVADLAKMPHMLIAGSTGSGKSVCINDLILSMIFKSAPQGSAADSGRSQTGGAFRLRQASPSAHSCGHGS